MAETPIYHICRRTEWEAAKDMGYYSGSSQDEEDGFIHFSTSAQVVESAARHRAGQKGLVLLVVNPRLLGTALRWEPARSGGLFPHLYGRLPVAAVRAAHDLPLAEDGRHVFPALD